MNHLIQAITEDKRLVKLIPQVSKTQCCVAALEEKLDASIGSSTSSGLLRKGSKSIDVPKIVQVWSTDNTVEMNRWNVGDIARNREIYSCK